VNARSSALELDDAAVLDALRRGDERVFAELVGRWSSVMLRMALAHIDNRAIAEEVVQDAWLTVLRSIDRFEGRSALRTWVIGIVVNIARSRARAERRTVALDAADAEPSVERARFLPLEHPRWPRHWAVEPLPWPTPEENMLAVETRRVILDAIATLPPSQREVVVLRDLEGLSSRDVCNVVGVTDTHQRVLLHRARSRVRKAIEQYLGAKEAK
jgi:RNA polymerase sigma-70 factor (ECF subfamily)